jgi:hemolysin type calcium-binding protein
VHGPPRSFEVQSAAGFKEERNGGVIKGRALRGILLMSFVVVALGGGRPAWAAPPDPVDDGNGTEWRQLYETTGLSWNQVAGICPRDGATPCSGSIGTKVLTGWVWATDAQVVELMGIYEPAILTADPPTLSGPEYFQTAAGFLSDMRWTIDVTTTYSHDEAAIGWTSSTDEGAPIGGAVALGFPPASGSFAVRTGDAATDVNSARGVWLWRPSGEDHTPPVITPTLDGAKGNNGWFVSDVSVAWDVRDDESAISEQVGCEPGSVTSDTSERSFSCEATSAGGTAAESAVVRRDTTAPTLTCGTPAPVFEIYQLGARVPASVTDATSGPAVSTVYGGPANTSRAGSFTVVVSGLDRAGNRGARSCPYKVIIPTCRGLDATRVGTAFNDVIGGTSGRDVIVALGGADTVNGGGGADVICGGDGPDTLDGQGGQDWIDGGASGDDIYGGAGDDTLDGGLHNDSLRGESGRDTCISGEIRMSSCEIS